MSIWKFSYIPILPILNAHTHTHMRTHAHTQDTRSALEDQLLSVKGVISFTIDCSRQRCTVRLRSDLKPEVSYCFSLKIMTTFSYSYSKTGFIVTSSYNKISVMIISHVNNLTLSN